MLNPSDQQLQRQRDRALSSSADANAAKQRASDRAPPASPRGALSDVVERPPRPPPVLERHIPLFAQPSSSSASAAASAAAAASSSSSSAASSSSDADVGCLLPRIPAQMNVNVYPDHTTYIIPHKDGRGDMAAILSLGGCVVFPLVRDISL